MANLFRRQILDLSQRGLLTLATLLLAVGCAAPRSMATASMASTAATGSGVGSGSAGTIGHGSQSTTTTTPAAPTVVPAATSLIPSTAPAPATTALSAAGSASASAGAAVKSYAFVDPTHLIDRGLLQTALAYFAKNKTLFSNQNYLAIIDYAKPSSQHRLFIINMHTGQVLDLPVAHGRGSDPKRFGIAKFFSDMPGSNASSLGFFRTADTYVGSHGLSLRLDGLSPSNTHARQRKVVIHGADYVANGRSIQGRSWGCPAVPIIDRDHVIQFLKNGSLLYAGLGKGE